MDQPSHRAERKETRKAARAARQRAMSLLDEFKKFVFKGSVVDLTVGVIIGAAFSNIVDSLVRNIVMPLASYIVPSSRAYEEWTIGRVRIGQFLAVVIHFLIISTALYLFIAKFLGLLLKSKKEEAPPRPTKDQELLVEIRDLLKAAHARPDSHANPADANRD